VAAMHVYVPRQRLTANSKRLIPNLSLPCCLLYARGTGRFPGPRDGENTKSAGGPHRTLIPNTDHCLKDEDRLLRAPGWLGVRLIKTQHRQTRKHWPCKKK